MKMEITNILIEYLQKEIVNIQNEINFNKKLYRGEIDNLTRKIRKIKQLLNVIKTNELSRGFIDYEDSVPVIMKSPISLPEKVEYICYLFNFNYSFFLNPENSLKYESIVEDDKKNFELMQKLHIKLSEIILEDNKIGYLKDPSYELKKEFLILGFSEQATDMIIDIALRNFEQQITKNI